MAGSEVNAGTGTPGGPARRWAPGPDGPALAEDPDRLQKLARRNLWMHFTRMGSYDEHHAVPVIVRGEGCYVYDEHGKRYLDGLSALYCVNVGHGRAEIAQAAAAQAEQLGFYTNWSYAHPPAIELAARVAEPRPRQPQPRVLHLRRLGGRRVGLEARQGLPPRARRPEPPQARLAQPRLPRRLDGRAHGDRAAAAARALRAAHPRRRARSEHELLPLERGPRPAVGGGRDRGGDRVRGPRHRRGGDPRAGPERRRLLHAPGRLLPARARDLRSPRRAADLRRGDLLLGPARALVRLRTLRLPARHDHDRQGHQLRLRAARRGDRGRPHRRAVPARHDLLRPRLHLRRAPGRLRGRAREHRRARARGPAGSRARERGRCSARCSTGCATCRSSATCAAPATSTRSSWSRTRRPRRPSTTPNPRSCCAASSPASSTGAA